MTEAAAPALAPVPADPPAPKKRGPKTPEGKARSAMNALRHGLRAQRFHLLPEESDADFAAFARRLKATYVPEDDGEREAIDGLAAALWQASRADAQEAAVLLAMRPAGQKGPDGLDLLESPPARASLATVLRYQAAAQNAARRMLALFLQHRKAKRAGVFQPLGESEAEPAMAEAAAESAAAGNGTNDLFPRPEPRREPAEVEGAEEEEEAFELPVVEADPEREEARRAILRSWPPGEQRRFAHCRLTDLERHQAIKDPDPTAYEAWFARQPKPPAERVPLSAEEKAQIAWVTRHNPPWLRGEYLGYYRPPVPKEAFGLDGDGVPCTGSGAQGEPEPAPAPANDASGESPVAALRARILRLLDRTAPRQPEELDLAEAICSLKWPKWPEYRGSIDLWRLRRALEGVEIDSRALYWLGSQELEKACKQARAP